jgi:hypothetical protein
MAEDHATATEAVLKRLQQEHNWPYLFSYSSPVNESNEPIKVFLETNDEKHRAETTYTADSEPKGSRSFAGLYLEISIGGQQVSRTLAGLTPWKSKQNPVTETHAKETRNALFGEFQISFEGEAPSPTGAPFQKIPLWPGKPLSPIHCDSLWPKPPTSKFQPAQFSVAKSYKLSIRPPSLQNIWL